MATTIKQNESDIRPAPATATSHDDAKHDIEMVEKVGADGALPEGTIMKSPFDDLGIRKTWTIFRKAAFMSLFAAFSAAAE